jgi:aspartate carbamoyltransferase catalytic subunit
MTLQSLPQQTGVAPLQAAEATQTGWSSRRHLLDLDDFAPGEIAAVLDTAEGMLEVLGRDIKKVPSLRGKVVMTLFYEPSTRTRVSFEQAGKLLSADVINISASGSSAEKGESLLNTALTLQAMRADLIVVRHQHSGAPYFMARHLANTGVVNAGDGRHAHPTQALLDLFTMRRHLGSLQGAKVVIVGDVLNSRVARSDIWGLVAAGARVVLSGPATLLPPASSSSDGYPLAQVEIAPDLDAAIEGADVVMALRLQKERQEGGMLPSLREYTRRWQVNDERLRSAKPGALLMHPGPINEGVEISSALAHGTASRIEEQVTNGVAVRMAILYLLLTRPHEEARAK